MADTLLCMLEPGEYAGADLAAEMRMHMAERFPASVEKGEDYGEVDAVMIGADIYGWALQASNRGSLSALDRTRLASAADELGRSIGALPIDAQPYYERALRMALQTLSET